MNSVFVISSPGSELALSEDPEPFTTFRGKLCEGTGGV